MALTSSELVALTNAHRAAQARRAAQIAALVALYYRTRVDVFDPASVQRWLEIMIPRIMRENDLSASLAIEFGDRVRAAELPDTKDRFKFEKASSLKVEQVKASLSIQGPDDLRKKVEEIRLAPEKDAVTKQALIKEALQVSETKVAAAVARHVQNGGRDTLLANTKRDAKALGYVRVVKGDPCYFCAMLASRGLVYSDDSFDESDARFTGAGNVKVHDSCGCSLKPAYRRDDPMLAEYKRFEDMWAEFSGGPGGALLSFRRGYEGRTDPSKWRIK